MRKYWTDEEDLLLINNYTIGTKDELIQLLSGRTYDAIKLRAAKLGVKKEIGICQRNNNVEILLNGSLQSYYWIGFILADGHIENNKRLAIYLSIKDKDHLDKFARYINTKTFPISNNKIGLTAQHISAIPILCDIFDIKSNKTENPPDFSSYIISDNQLLALIIGFIDGDGSITNVHKREDFMLRIKVHSSWIDNLEFIENFIYNKYNLSKKVDKLSKINNQGYAQLNITNNKIIKLLKNFISEKQLYCLSRKWDKIL